MNSNASITPEQIAFQYPDQRKFPPKKSKRHFDCEAFFYLNDSLYLFTKSRSPKDHGLTNLYSLPAKKGKYKAKYIRSYNTCDDKGCWITSVDINEAKDKIALLTEYHLFLFSNFSDANFFDGDLEQITFDYRSQKESVCFKNDSILYIADENQGIRGGNLYELELN